jgi:hypothetical protein
MTKQLSTKQQFDHIIARFQARRFHRAIDNYELQLKATQTEKSNRPQPRFPQYGIKFILNYRSKEFSGLTLDEQQKLADKVTRHTPQALNAALKSQWRNAENLKAYVSKTDIRFKDSYTLSSFTADTENLRKVLINCLLPEIRQAFINKITSSDSLFRRTDLISKKREVRAREVFLTQANEANEAKTVSNSRPTLIAQIDFTEPQLFQLAQFFLGPKQNSRTSQSSNDAKALNDQFRKFVQCLLESNKLTEKIAKLVVANVSHGIGFDQQILKDCVAKFPAIVDDATRAKIDALPGYTYVVPASAPADSDSTPAVPQR